MSRAAETEFRLQKAQRKTAKVKAEFETFAAGDRIEVSGKQGTILQVGYEYRHLTVTFDGDRRKDTLSRADYLTGRIKIKRLEDCQMVAKLEAPPREELERRFEECGWSINRMAKAYGVSWPVARDWLVKYDLITTARMSESGGPCKDEAEAVAAEAEQMVGAAGGWDSEPEPVPFEEVQDELKNEAYVYSEPEEQVEAIVYGEPEPQGDHLSRQELAAIVCELADQIKQMFDVKNVGYGQFGDGLHNFRSSAIRIYGRSTPANMLQVLQVLQDKHLVALSNKGLALKDFEERCLDVAVYSLIAIGIAREAERR